MKRAHALGAVAAAGYVGTIVAANWAISRYGMVPVGFGLAAPAGVYFAGLAFGLRDATQELAGKPATLAAVAVGAAVSYLVASPQLAAASALAFGLSELADWSVYQPLRDRSRAVAVAASNTVGLLVDSALFLWVAFGSLQYLPGQVVGKTWMTLLAVAVTAFARGRRRAAPVPVGAG